MEIKNKYTDNIAFDFIVFVSSTFFTSRLLFSLYVQLMMHVLDIRDSLDSERFVQVKNNVRAFYGLSNTLLRIRMNS